MTIKNIILSSGPTTLFIYLGSLQTLFNNNYLKYDSIEKFYGTSMGSLLSLMLILAKNPSVVIEKLSNQNFLQLLKFNVLNVLKLEYLYTANEIRNIIIQLIEPFLKEYNLDKNFTFQDLYNATNKKIIINTSSMLKQGGIIAEYFKLENAPNYSVVDAVVMTCTIPFVFEPIIYNGNLQLDGGLLNLDNTNYCLNENNKNECFKLSYIAIGKTELFYDFNNYNFKKFFIGYNLSLQTTLNNVNPQQSIPNEIIFEITSAIDYNKILKLVLSKNVVNEDIKMGNEKATTFLLQNN